MCIVKEKTAAFHLLYELSLTVVVSTDVVGVLAKVKYTLGVVLESIRQNNGFVIMGNDKFNFHAAAKG